MVCAYQEKTTLLYRVTLQKLTFARVGLRLARGRHPVGSGPSPLLPRRLLALKTCSLITANAAQCDEVTPFPPAIQSGLGNYLDDTQEIPQAKTRGLHAFADAECDVIGRDNLGKPTSVTQSASLMGSSEPSSRPYFRQ